MTTRTRTRGGRRTTTPQHGTESEYRRGCRCDLCKQAMTAARRARQDRHDRNEDLERSRRELDKLQKTAPVPGKAADVEEALYRAYVIARQARDVAERELLTAELELKRAIGDASIVRVNRRRVGTWGWHERRHFDSQAFRQKHPGMWDRFQKSSGARRFIVTMFAATPPQRSARATAKGVAR